MLSKNDNLTLEEISPLLRKNLKASPQEILESIQGNLTKEQNSKMESETGIVSGSFSTPCVIESEKTGGCIRK